MRIAHNLLAAGLVLGVSAPAVAQAPPAPHRAEQRAAGTPPTPHRAEQRAAGTPPTPHRAEQRAAGTPPPPLTKTISLGGPRVGFTSLSPGVIDKLKENNLQVRPLMTQFGWQFEKQFYSKASGLSALNEWVVLIGGLEQGLAIPSLNWIVGLRTREGAEFGVGPNLTPAGAALAIAAGVTFRTGALNIPMNVAMVPSKDGVRVSVLSGFNFRRR
jgi:hypothetical protein